MPSKSTKRKDAPSRAPSPSPPTKKPRKPAQSPFTTPAASSFSPMRAAKRAGIGKASPSPELEPSSLLSAPPGDDPAVLRARIEELESLLKLARQQAEADEKEYEKQLTATSKSFDARQRERLEKAHAKQIKKFERQFEKLRKDAEEAGDEEAAVRKACEEIVGEKEEVVQSLKRELAVAKAQPHIWEARANKAIKHLQQAKNNALDQANRRIEKLEKEMDEANAALDTRDQTVVYKQENLAAVRDERMIMRTQLASAHTTITNLERTISGHEKMVVDLRKKLDNLKKEMNKKVDDAHAHNTIEGLEERIADLKKKLEKEKEVKDRYFEDSQRYYNKSKGLETEVKTGKEEAEKLKKRLTYEKNRAKELGMKANIKREDGDQDTGEAEAVVVGRGPEQMEDGT